MYAKGIVDNTLNMKSHDLLNFTFTNQLENVTIEKSHKI